ncbi:MAG: DUF6494 family protein [Gammaproteobacteria bacterium]|nr:DUF6494 family protein [Gammaproteobacteria bacterium]MDJ0890520.1 DUF6494 family protein [Gammaproteobacteria bacterium]
MNEDVFNLEIRKLLKKVGITFQREIERSVREALDAGKLKGNETLKATVTLELAELSVKHAIDGDIRLDD